MALCATACGGFALDRPPSFCNMAIKTGKPLCGLPALLQIMGSAAKDERRRAYTCPASPKTSRLLFASRSQTRALFPPLQNVLPPLCQYVFRVPRRSRYNTLHFASQSRVPKGVPLWKPRPQLRVNLTRSCGHTHAVTTAFVPALCAANHPACARLIYSRLEKTAAALFSKCGSGAAPKIFASILDNIIYNAAFFVYNGSVT